MIKKFSQLDLTKQYTYADYLTWQFEERLELIKGWIMKMSPAPSTLHQRISSNLSVDFGNFYRKKTCSVFTAPFDVRLPNSKKSTADKTIMSVVQPDICIICDPKKIDERGCIGAPDLIVEIVSKGNTKKELENKYELYQENGVKEYWIVFQNDEIVQVFDLVRGKYKLRKTYSNDSLVPVGITKDLVIDLKEIFN
jgi:Uma2 family endonuclease